MSNTCVIGIQWGDEGKGKIIDVLTEKTAMVVRYQGGSNAGHTVVVGDKKYVLHQLPSGIIRPNLTNVIANGVVLDPISLLEEISDLKADGIEVGEKLKISDRAHVVFDYHKQLDGLKEKSRGDKAIGTTQRGIGPCYTDKVARSGIRMGELVNPDRLAERLKENVESLNHVLTRLYEVEPVSFDEIYQTYAAAGKKLAPFVTDTISLIHDTMNKDLPLLFEGAQGSLLDIDFGTYPYTTSSNSTACGITTGTGVPPKRIGRVLGVLKAYTTRVGEGPFPVELHDEVGKILAEKGAEFGATTGRPRRCGWLDLVAAGFSTMINGLDALAITKLDVLAGLEEVKVCHAYRYQGRTLKTVPADLNVLSEVEPVYRSFPGWGELDDARKVDDLPGPAKVYLDYISETLHTPIEMISVGQRRREVIFA